MENDTPPINSSFSTRQPSMQLGLDSTSLREFATCPRRYWYSTIRGLVPRAASVHLQFGIWMHQAREWYEHSRAGGADHNGALDATLDRLLHETWDHRLGRPWLSDHPSKNRKTLIQTAVWYLDASERDRETFRTVVMANGKPATELSFRFDSGIETALGEHIIFCGHLDRIVEFGGQRYVADLKTTSSEPNAIWAREFTPGTQFSMYTLAGKVAFGEQLAGVIVDGVQVGVGFARFRRHLVPRTDQQLGEWFRGMEALVGEMERAAEQGFWRQNDTACKMYGGCPYQSLCAMSPGSRGAWESQGFTTRMWDPLQARGASE